MIKYIFSWLIIVCIVTAKHRRKEKKHHRSDPEINFTFVNRKDWGAHSAKVSSPLQTPVPYVHTYYVHVPYQCVDRKRCSQSMKYLQKMHQNVNRWGDIAYNFAVGGDNAVYEGRGWKTMGAHAHGFNSHSVSIALLESENQIMPTNKQKEVAQKLINYGVQHKYIKPFYSVAGHQFIFPRNMSVDMKTINDIDDDDDIMSLNINLEGSFI